MKKRKKTKCKIKWDNTITVLIILICISTLIYSIIKVYSWYNDTQKTNKLMEIILKNTEIIEIENNNINKEIIKNYYNYTNTKLIHVDFGKLKAINNDILGWIQVNGTNINYPFVQYSNNEYYLTHSFDKSYNEAGWIFLDHRNNINDLNKNTIIYAHGRVGNKMFGTLRTIFDSKWYLNKNNYYIKLSTEKENTIWEVFSLYKIKTTNDYLQINFNDDNEFENFLNILKKRSYYIFNTLPNKNDKIITLSTCYNQYNKVVMHAKLIKSELN